MRRTRLGVVGLLERGRAWGYHGPDPLRAWQGTKPLPPPVHPQPFVATSLSASGWGEVYGGLEGRQFAIVKSGVRDWRD